MTDPELSERNSLSIADKPESAVPIGSCLKPVGPPRSAAPPARVVACRLSSSAASWKVGYVMLLIPPSARGAVVGQQQKSIFHP